MFRFPEDQLKLCQIPGNLPFPQEKYSLNISRYGFFKHIFSNTFGVNQDSNSKILCLFLNIFQILIYKRIEKEQKFRKPFVMSSLGN